MNRFLLLGTLVLALGVGSASADCPEEPPVQRYTPGNAIPCPCFIAGEEAGSVLDAPAEHYPIEILRIGIGWASQYGGQPDAFEAAIHVYGAGLPDPGAPLYSLDGPVLVDGFINEFNVEGAGWIVESGPFAATLEFFNDNGGNPFAASVIYDTNGCQPQVNLVYAIPGGWNDACALGVPGDWFFHIVYRQVDCGQSSVEEFIASGAPALLMNPQPNPFSGETRIDFRLNEGGAVSLSVHDALGRKVETLSERLLETGVHQVTWDGTGADGSRLPSGVYFVNLRVGRYAQTRKVILGQ